LKVFRRLIPPVGDKLWIRVDKGVYILDFEGFKQLLHTFPTPLKGGFPLSDLRFL